MHIRSLAGIHRVKKRPNLSDQQWKRILYQLMGQKHKDVWNDFPKLKVQKMLPMLTFIFTTYYSVVNYICNSSTWVYIKCGY